jgi:hypothetical protein
MSPVERKHNKFSAAESIRVAFNHLDAPAWLHLSKKCVEPHLAAGYKTVSFVNLRPSNQKTDPHQ